MNIICTAAHEQKPFSGTCWRHGEVGHKVWECEQVANRPKELKDDRVNEAAVANENIDTAIKKGGEEMAEGMNGQEANAEGLGDEATDNVAQ